jgi:outer membrane protein assembly factor BamD (BamD/ComL family)
MWKVALLMVAVGLCAAGAARGDQGGDQTFEFRDGRWLEVTKPTTQPVVDEPMLDQAEALLMQNNLKETKKVLVAWEKTHKHSPVRDRCIMLFADLFYQKDQRLKSFFYCDELMDEYPESKLFPAALQKQFDIATEYMNGYKDSFLGFHVLDMGSEAVEMMWRIQQRAPGSPLAEKGLLSTADYYYGSGQYDLAEDAYNAYWHSYPNSDKVPLVKLHAAFASLAQFRGVKFDASKIIDARVQLLEIQRKYPDLAEEENVETVIEQIDSAFAKKLLEEGAFYQRTHEPRGAAYEYRFLAQTYPNSPEAAEARGYLKDMPAWVLADAPPPPASGYAPTTEPSVTAAQ